MAKDNNSKVLSILSHILGIFTGFIGALIIYLVAEDKEVKDNARNALNWQLSALIYSVISVILIIVLIGFILIIAVAILNLVFCILAAIKSSEGRIYEYPLTIKFLKK